MGMWEDKGCWVWSLSMLRGRQYQIDTISCEKADSWGTLTCRGGLTKARDLTKKKKSKKACLWGRRTFRKVKSWRIPKEEAILRRKKQSALSNVAERSNNIKYRKVIDHPGFGWTEVGCWVWDHKVKGLVDDLPRYTLWMKSKVMKGRSKGNY